MTFDLKNYMRQVRERVDAAMEFFLPRDANIPEKLIQAMRYSLFAPGKRIRPVLTFASADALGLNREAVLPIAVSLEMIHVFSLVHDDLPAMDDDDFRRGQPTNHKVYGEAMAILAGDGLLAEAFVPLTHLDAREFGITGILGVIREIAKATGVAGMIGGQVIDMEAEGKTIAMERLKTLHAMKTGALIRAAIMAPAILSGQKDLIFNALKDYAEHVGLAFQIADDILDVEGGSEIGKDVGSDARRGKSTYVSLLGLDGSKREKVLSFERAAKALNPLGEKAQALNELARFIVERHS